MGRWKTGNRRKLKFLMVIYFRSLSEKDGVSYKHEGIFNSLIGRHFPISMRIQKENAAASGSSGGQNALCSIFYSWKLEEVF